jgi:UDP-2,3-diacylglucosamine hydrolase
LKTYFVSDVHLGSLAMNNNHERELLFVNWLEQASHDAKAIYLLGDIFDFWYEYKKVAPRGFVRTLGKIAELTDKGIEVYFFTGNHDLWVNDYLPSETGVKVVKEPILKTIDDKMFFLAHGDGLNPNEKGYLMLRRIFTSKTVQFLFSCLHPNIAFWIGHLWAKKSRLAKGTEPELSLGPEFEANVTFAKQYSLKNKVDYFIMGHRHIMMDEAIDASTRVIMLGEWFNLFSYAVFDGETLELKKITY